MLAWPLSSTKDESIAHGDISLAHTLALNNKSDYTLINQSATRFYIIQCIAYAAERDTFFSKIYRTRKATECKNTTEPTRRDAHNDSPQTIVAATTSVTVADSNFDQRHRRHSREASGRARRSAAVCPTIVRPWRKRCIVNSRTTG